MKNWVAALLAAIFASCALPASAATVTQTIAFSATDFFAFGAYPVPVDPVSGSITVTYDPSIEVQFVTTGVTLNGINIPHDTSYPLMLFNSPAAGQIGSAESSAPPKRKNARPIAGTGVSAETVRPRVGSQPGGVKARGLG
jgi:hypothetical protein